MKYAEYLCERLKDNENYTHCYFVAGGNIMHLIDAARSRFECIPVVHEVAAGIAAEYFNETNKEGKKAFVLVTAGPGLTNVVTAIAGAFLESRELLVIGGQVKRTDLKTPKLRQRGIQEIDGNSIVDPITNESILISEPILYSELRTLLHKHQKPGPIFLEIPLDVQGIQMENEEIFTFQNVFEDSSSIEILKFVEALQSVLSESNRPIILLGGGLTREKAANLNSLLANCGIPIMTTWNGADRYGSDQINYWGRPNTWGQRAANMLIQQSDCVIAVGTRLGLQQTGFAWEEFAPLAKIFQVDIDKNELEKGHPKIFSGLASDAGEFLEKFLKLISLKDRSFEEWHLFGQKLIENFPLNDIHNETAKGFIDPYEFILELSTQSKNEDVIIPCSSGGAFTVTLQAFKSKFGQTIVSNKGLASMGYGLAAAIGAAESTKSRTILIEGDGGFAQNLQELGTVRQRDLNLKIFIFSNRGYASIRMTQRNYFNGAYLGCDVETGLGMPNWEFIAKAYNLPYFEMESPEQASSQLKKILEWEGPTFTVIKIDPDQTYFPKIMSRVLPDGSMASNPLHLMTPDLLPEQVAEFLPYLSDRINLR
jgi:acetolactate synthase-1/2/3 large subunit